MPWTPWIDIEKDDTTQDEAKQLYETTRNPLTGKISDLTRITSLTPAIAQGIDALCTAVYRNASGLTAREKEIAALVNFAYAVPRADLHLYLGGIHAQQPRMTLAEMPEKFHTLDDDGDGYLSFDEMLTSIDKFFDFDSDLETNDVYLVINFFFAQ